MDEIVFWLLLAGSTALTGMLLVKYLGRFGALVIMLLVLWVAWIAGFSRFFEWMSSMILKLGQTLIAFILSLF